ncbi:S8 family peptidase [bacterium SCSIO 12643]|nr:S8 family peptidase [bacterium SCSIO 12643]
MKKSYIIWIGIWLFSLGLNAQNKMSAQLLNDLQNSPKQWQQVLVVGSERVDGFAYSQTERAKYTSNDEFVKSFLKELRDVADKNQNWLEEVPAKEFKVIYKFWSVNMVALEASPKALQYLNHHPDIYWMEELSERPVIWDKPVEMNPATQRSIGGIENGISVVKADQMWSMGYTGLGSKLLTFDTGVWPDHPTFRDQFLGYHVPLKEAWFGYDTYFPGDKPGSHGTHVTGTCLGLAPQNDDTIGVAYNAYFMATDPIVEDLADIKTAFELMRAYEWALNPDGDLNTVEDMPDVINNSWGRPYTPDDSAVCDGWVNDLFVNMEVANIISIHSAGNSGPNMQTIGYPAVSNASVVNNFSVGAVNGHISSYPIAGFSSRGPSVCGDTGSLLIKPEVVGPGVNVRSGVRNTNGTYDYSNFQGTSMSAPHVSGVSLLLREAFPNANATEIKEALYYTAIDLGVVGEDNTYGNGLIDAVAAFNYLSNIHTPAVPVFTNLDIHLTDFSVKEQNRYCNPGEIKAYFNNTVDVPYGTVQFQYGVVGQSSQFKNITSGTFKTDDSVTFDVSMMLQPGWNEFFVRTSYFGQLSETDTINNTRYVRFWNAGQMELPYQEKFDSNHVFESSMFVQNPDERLTWDTALVQGKSQLSHAALMKLSDYDPRLYQHDYLETPLIKTPVSSSLTMTFDLSYQLRFNGFKDSVFVDVSTDCGQSWVNSGYVKGPDSLNTTTKPVTGDWVPQDDTDWRTETVDLSSFLNTSSFMVRIGVSNGKGNYLYIDNVNVFDDQGPLSVKNPEQENWMMYPNPNQLKTLHFNAEFSGEIYTITGVKIHTFVNRNQLDISNLNSGIYIVYNRDLEAYKKLIVR